VRPRRRRRGLPGAGGSGGALVALLGLGALVALVWALGGLGGNEEAGISQPPGTVAVPISPRALPPYERVTLEDLFRSRGGRIAYVYLEPDDVRSEMLTELSQIVGRVLRKPKAAGFAFTERDFAPPGTRPGLAAGVPPGHRALRVDVSKVNGLEELRPGDRFDLVATIALDEQDLPADSLAGSRSSQAVLLDPRLSQWSKQASVEVIAQNGLVVSPVETRQVPISVNTLTQGAITRTRPVQEVVIAVAPEEVALLTQALAVEARIQCVIRSGHPDDPEDSVTPGAIPRSPFDLLRRGAEREGARGGYALVETLGSGGRRYRAVQRPGAQGVPSLLRAAPLVPEDGTRGPGGSDPAARSGASGAPTPAPVGPTLPKVSAPPPSPGSPAETP